MAVFGGYAIICGLVTTKYGLYGYYANLLYWMGSMISSIASPYLSYYLFGIKGSLIIGAFTYAIYILGFNLHHLYFIMIASIINGIGSGLFRTNMNIWLVSQIATTDERKYHDELYVGVYNTIFGFSTIISASIGIVIYNTDIDIYWTAFVITMGSVLLLFFITPAQLNITHYVSLAGYKDLIIEFWYIYPLIAFQGFNTIYINSIMTLNFNGDIQFIMVHFLVYSIGFCITSHLLGWLGWNNPHKEYFWIILLMIITGGLSGVYIIIIRYYLINIYLCYLSSSFLAGMTEATIYYLIIILFNSKYSDNKSTVFAYHRTIYSMFAGLSQIYCSLVSMNVIIISLNLLMIISSIIFLRYYK